MKKLIIICALIEAWFIAYYDFPALCKSATIAGSALGRIMDRVAGLSGNWVNAYGFYLPTHPVYGFITWKEIVLYATIAALAFIIARQDRRFSRRLAVQRFEHGEQGSAGMRSQVQARDTAVVTSWTDPGMVHDALNKGNKNNFSICETERLIQKAISCSGSISFDYVDRHGSYTRRKVRPLRIYRSGGRGYFEGYCCLRGDTRNFMIARMRGVE